MKPLSWGSVALATAAGLGVGLALSSALLALGHSPPLITPWLSLLFILIAVALLWGGRAVRHFKADRTSNLSPLSAARIAMFSRSAAVNGGIFSGFLAGILIVSLFRTWAPATAAAALGAGVSLAGALVMTIVAWVVEGWCVDDSDGPGEDGSGRPRREEDPRSAGAARVTHREGEPWRAK